MKMKVKMRRVFGIILSLVLALGLIPEMSMTAHADNTETLLATITATGQTTYDQSVEGVVTVTLANIAYYDDTYGWLSRGTITVEPVDGYTITKCRFIQNNKTPLDDDLAPFSIVMKIPDTPDEERCSVTTSTGQKGGGMMDGVTSIEVYGYATTVAVTGVSLNKNSTTLTVGDTETLTSTASPDNASNKSVTWSSDNTSVATVDANGKVTAVSSGTANITVTTTDGSKTATCAVTVNATSSGGDSSDSGNSGSTSGDSSDSGNSPSDSTDSGSSSGSSDNTNTNTDTSAKVPYDDVPISTGSVTDITGTAAATAESNPFGTKIENNSNLTTLLSLTDAEVAQGVNVWLDIQDMSSSVSKSDKSKIEKKSGDYTVGMYLDINLFKKVGNNDATKVSETNGKIKASIVIPKKLRKSGRTFEIIRVHNGKASTITGKYTKKTHVFTFETDKFSTYAIAYKDAASSTDSETTDSSSTTTSTTTSSTATSSTGSATTTATAPKTGETSDMRFWCLLIFASLGGLGIYEVSRKKRENQ